MNDIGKKTYEHIRGLLYGKEQKEMTISAITMNYVFDYVDNLQSKIDKVNRILNANTHVENIYHALCNLFDEEYQYEIDNEELNKILKEAGK